MQRDFTSIHMKKALQSSRDIIIQVDDWAKAIEFYETTLGFPIVHRSPDIVGFETGALCLYVEKGKRPGPVFDFLVSDARGIKDRLLAAGCTIVEENPAVPRCYIRDPFGLVFNIEQTEERV
jgi:catechol 2,3-dioxygenase-like lactoylglutathione lyase family enzyme